MESAKISCRSDLEKVNYVFSYLDDRHKEMFTNSCFGKLLELRKTKEVGYQLFHQIMLRQIKSEQTTEVWFNFKGKHARFGLKEFTLVTGLNAGELGDEFIEEGNESHLLEKYFKSLHGYVNRKDLLKAFDKCNVQEDKYKLGLLVCLVWVLLGAEERTLLSLWLFHIVEDLDEFNRYPWGKKSFLHTLTNFKQKWDDVKEKKERNVYNLKGFPFAVVVWGFEAIPALGEEFAESCGERVPRMISWKVKHRLRSQDLNTFIESREYKVKCKLVPTEAEKLEAFWMQMTSLDLDDGEDLGVDPHDDVKSASKGGSIGDSDDDGDRSAAEKEPADFKSSHFHAANKPNLYSEEFVAELINKKLGPTHHKLVVMEKKVDKLLEMEKRLDKFDEMDKKIDRLISLLENNQERPLKQTVAANEEHNSQKSGEARGQSFGSMVQKTEIGDEKGEAKDNEVDSTAEDEINMKGVQVDEDAQCLGRGNRKRKLASSLCPPFTDPIKKRKLKNVTRFDPKRVVDNSKLEELKRWLSIAMPSDIIPMALYEVKRKFFDDLMGNGCLNTQHVDLALYHIRERAIRYPKLFPQDSCILDSYFVPLVLQILREPSEPKRRVKVDKKSALETLLNDEQKKKLVKKFSKYVEGAAPELSKPWKECRFLYAPCGLNDHWFAVRIDLVARHIYIYDSSSTYIRRSKFQELVTCLKTVIPLLMHLKGDEQYETEQFSFSKPASPRQENGFDCGMFALKFIEFLHAGKDINEIQQADMAGWRKKLAAEIFAQEFDP